MPCHRLTLKKQKLFMMKTQSFFIDNDHNFIDGK